MQKMRIERSWPSGLSYRLMIPHLGKRGLRAAAPFQAEERANCAALDRP